MYPDCFVYPVYALNPLHPSPFTVSLFCAVAADHVRIGIEAESGTLRHGYRAGSGYRGFAVQAGFQVVETPFDQRFPAHCRTDVQTTEKCRAVVEAARGHRDIVSRGEREYLAQFRNSPHLSRARLQVIDRARFQQMLELHERG